MTAEEKRLRCRVTVHMPGGARPGDVVLVDPTDPWMAARIPQYLVPLEPWEPVGLALAEVPSDLPALSSPAAPGDDATVGADGSASGETGDVFEGVGLSEGG